MKINPDATDILQRTFKEEVLAGLSGEQKSLHSKYFYDSEGDRLFQQIMASPEYYLTRCEQEIFQHRSPDLAQLITSEEGGFDLIELGAGDATKSRYLLRYLIELQLDFTYRPIDISGHILRVLQSRLEKELPELKIVGLQGEYFTMLRKASELSSRRKLVMFLGANIGNMNREEAAAFCRKLRSYLDPGDLLLIGFDLKKHPKVILDAYNDAAGLTSRFNLNLLSRINRELDGNFQLDRFEHYQTYDPGTGSCNSYLVSLQAQEVTVAGNTISFRQDETIFMEVSQKYSLKETEALAAGSGFLPVRNITDSKGWFVDASWIAV